MDPFCPVSSHSSANDPNIFAQNVDQPGNSGNVQSAALAGNTNSAQEASSGADLQSVALAGNISSVDNFVLPGNPSNIPNPAFFGNVGVTESAALAGNTGNIQNAALFGNSNLQNMAFTGSSGNLLAVNPGQILGSSCLLYNGGTFLPAATSGMALLPQASYDSAALLLQQQYALNPDLLAASLGQTLSLSQTQAMPQTLDLLKSPASLPQIHPVPPTPSLPQIHPVPPTSSLPQVQPVPPNPSLPQVHLVPPNLSLPQVQSVPPNLSLPQVQPVPPNPSLPQVHPVPPNPSLPQVQSVSQNPNLPQAQPVPQTMDLLHTQASLPQNADLQQLQVSLSQVQPAPNGLDSLEPQVVCPPPMGHSFDVLSAVIAANQAGLTSPLQTRARSPTLVSPQLLSQDSASGLPPSLTGLPPLHSADLLGSRQHKSPLAPKDSVSDASPENAGIANQTLHTSSSSDNADDQKSSGVGSSAPSSPSDSCPTLSNSDLPPLTCQVEENVQQMMVEPRYDRPSDRGACMRCGKKVYTMEKLGPVKEVLYHKTCFTCVACHTLLNLKNFNTNDADLADLNVYCGSHKPTARANPLDSRAVGIQRALTVPRHGRVNEQIRGGPHATSVHMDFNSVSIRSAVHAPAPDLQASIKQREGAWFREERKYEGMPPQDVAKYDGQTEKYEGSRSLYNNPT